VRVVIAEDFALLSDGVIRLPPDNGHEVVAAVEDGDALVRAVAGTSPTSPLRRAAAAELPRRGRARGARREHLRQARPAPSDTDHCRVLAVLAFLGGSSV
jgi:hypothetical protein